MLTALVAPFLFLFAFPQFDGVGARYEPTWNSLDSRPLPGWYDEGKFGIFIHWGVFSVPAFGSEWFWEHWQGTKKRPEYAKYMKDNYPPDFTYADFAPRFRAEFYEPLYWADVLKKSGAKYVVLVSKHHEGFTNWPSNYSWNWNAGDVGPKRDLVGDLANAVRQTTDIKFGLYHSMYEWFNPLYLQDKKNGFKTQNFVTEKTMPELYEIVNRYKPEVVWSDGDWEAVDTYWKSKEFLAWLFNDSPVKDTVVVNDRWGSGTHCKHGSFWNCKDHFQPVAKIKDLISERLFDYSAKLEAKERGKPTPWFHFLGKLVPHKWENCMKIDVRSWGFRANAKISSFQSIERLIGQLVTTVSLGGNMLLNIGPTSYGAIPPIYQERLLQVGSWLDVNGEAIYKTHVWSHQNDSVAKDVWYTAKKEVYQKVVYAVLLQWPNKEYLHLADPKPSWSTSISLVGAKGQLEFISVPGGGINITLPRIPYSEMPCQWAWVFKMTNLLNYETKLNLDSFSRKLDSIRMHEE